jgi:hypothetical protein
MEAVLFVLFAAVVAVAGIGLGLAMAPRLGRWDERRSRAEDERRSRAGADGSVEAEGEVVDE